MMNNMNTRDKLNKLEDIGFGVAMVFSLTVMVLSCVVFVLRILTIN